MKTVRSYIEWLSRVRAEVAGDRATAIAGGDFVQPTVQLEDAGHLTVPHTVPVAGVGCFVVANATHQGVIVVSPGPGSGGLIVTQVGLRAGTTDSMIGVKTGTAADFIDILDTNIDLSVDGRMVSEGPALADARTGHALPATIAGIALDTSPQLEAGQSYPFSIYVRPGRTFILATRAVNNALEGWIMWQEYPHQPMPLAG